METIKEQINKAYLKAFKGEKNEENKQIKIVLSVIKSDIINKEKSSKIENLPDSEIITIIKKSVKTLSENLEKYPNSEQAQVYLWESEKNILESFLPSQMSEIEVRGVVSEIISSVDAVITVKDMGKIMGQFNAKYAGLADGKMVSNIIKEYLGIVV